jgi:cyanophycinase
MEIVANSLIEKAIRDAYKNGSTVAGTRAGASVMSASMITGNQLADTSYAETFEKIMVHNAELKPGLGLLKNEIIDQHFIVRSRYNRMFSIAADDPKMLLIGIDESTAIIVHHNMATVTGANQVVVLRRAKGLHTNEDKAGFSKLEMSIYLPGEKFSLRE